MRSAAEWLTEGWRLIGGIRSEKAFQFDEARLKKELDINFDETRIENALEAFRTAIQILESETVKDGLDVGHVMQHMLAQYGCGLMLNELARLGNVANKMERHQEALEALDQALVLLQILRSTSLEITVHVSGAYYERGHAFRGMKLWNKALQAFDEAIEVDSNFADAHEGRGRALNELERYEEALQAFDEAHNFDDKWAGVHDGRGTALLNAGHPEKALAAFRTACQIKPKEPVFWYNRGVAAEKEGNLGEAHRCRLRLLDLSRRVQRPDRLREARGSLPGIFRTLATQGVAPLLLARLALEEGLEGAVLGSAGALTKAGEACAPYYLLEAYYQFTDAPPDRKNRILGALARALGDPFKAMEHFIELDLPGRDELHAARNLAVCLDDIFRSPAEVEATVEDGIEIADELQIGQEDREQKDPEQAKTEREDDDPEDELSAEQLYDAGHLYAMAEDPRWAKARAAFGCAAEQGHQAAAYMNAWATRQDPSAPEAAFEDAAQAALDLETRRSTGDTPEPDALEDAEETVRWMERRILQAVQRAETQEARHVVVTWARSTGREVPEATPRPGAVRLGTDLLQRLRDEMARSGAGETLKGHVEALRRSVSKDMLKKQRILLDRDPDVPAPVKLLDKRDLPETRAETLGHRIRNVLTETDRDKRQRQRAMNQEIWAYLMLSGKITPEHALSLFAYQNLADLRVPYAEMLETAVDVGIPLATAGVVGYQSSGEALDLLYGMGKATAATVTICLIKRRIKEVSGTGMPEYLDFHEALHSDLEGQAGAVYDQVQAFLDAFPEPEVSESEAPDSETPDSETSEKDVEAN